MKNDNWKNLLPHLTKEEIVHLARVTIKMKDKRIEKQIASIKELSEIINRQSATIERQGKLIDKLIKEK